MNKYRKYIFLISFLIVVSMFLPVASFAQPDPGCDPLDPACPIDGGLSFLIAAGIGLGAKKIYELKRKSTKEL